ncbi:hypothetical protein L3X38_002001 [Prunus dulcis]|uniref:Transposase MuDR plant domain-containing protein n=1 Tax=Prunus dulcis TaxID=3755 RepID=A0AAD4WUN7_PRUDU|nr:hypothetical protein L3X38_002001 [Prunus dulcis]
MFEECIDNPIEEEPEEMGYAWEISDDVQNSKDLHSKQDNDDECDENGEVTNNRRKRNAPNFRQWRREAMLKNPTFDIGMHFANKTVFKEAVQHYTCMVGKNIWFKKDDKQRVRVACEVGCPFVIFASRIDESLTMVIKTLNLEHEFSRDQRNYWLNSTFFAQRYANELRADPDWSVPGFTAAIQRDFGLEPSMQQIYRAKLKATKLNKGSFVEQFHKLHDYCEELKRANPGSTVLLKIEMDCDQRRFHRLYICLEACKTGFLQGCRPVIGMDGCFIKGPHPDKQKGLGLALGDLLPNAEHRHCVRHFYNNFKTSHSGLTLKQIMWDAARATTIPWWQCHMERMKQESEVAWKWLHPKSAVHWSRSHFRSQYKCDILLNNLCEAFNSSILKARDKPIMLMLEGIRTNLMVRMANRRVEAWKWKRHVGPRIEQIMEKNKLEAGYCIPTLSGDMKYQVARGGRKMQQSRSNSNALAGTSISQPSLAVVRFSQPSPAPQVASQPPTAHNSSSQQASTSQTVQRRKLKSPAKKGRPWRV